MSKELDKYIVPELRFSIFENDGEWVETTLGKITKKITNNKNKEGLNYPVYSINNIDGFVPQSEQFNGIDSKGRGYDIKLYKIVGKNTFAYNPARINIGSIGYSGDLHDIIISSLYICFKTNEDINDQFLHYFFETFVFKQSVLNNVEGGIRNYLFYDNFARIEIKLPQKLEEQKKIACCFASIDNLINAQTRKLYALKEFRKGLIQQLFSVKEEKVPRLRFPEFEDEGGWLNECFDRLYSFKVTNSFSREKLNYEKGDVKNIHYGDIHTKYSTLLDITKEQVPFVNTDVDLQKIKTESYCVEGDLIFADASEDIDDIGKSLEIVNLNGEKVLSGLHTLLARRKNKKIVNRFGGYLFKSSRIREQIKRESQGAKVLGISGSRISKIKVCYPINPLEQKKIAKCLASIDELISIQDKKVDSLKDHKKGLMQQLFPET